MMLLCSFLLFAILVLYLCARLVSIRSELSRVFEKFGKLSWLARAFEIVLVAMLAFLEVA
jgi:hypothetical protein